MLSLAECHTPKGFLHEQQATRGDGDCASGNRMTGRTERWHACMCRRRRWHGWRLNLRRPSPSSMSSRMLCLKFMGVQILLRPSARRCAVCGIRPMHSVCKAARMAIVVTHTRVRACVHAFVRVCVRVCVRARARVRVCVCVCVCVFARACMSKSRARICKPGVVYFKMLMRASHLMLPRS